MIEFFTYPQTWNDWLNIYLSIGGIFVLGFLVKIIKNKPANFAHELMQTLGHKKTLSEKCKDVLAHLLAFAIIFIAWPGIIAWFISDKRQQAKDLKWQNKPDFLSAPQFLTKVTSVEEAEEENYINDPYQLTPNLPFGHLNTAWLMFLENKLESDELRYFDVPKGSEVGKYDRISNGPISGIALLRNNAIYKEFLIECDY